MSVNVLKTSLVWLMLPLTVVEGIGPKIAGVFKDAGIATWADLAAKKPEELKELLAAAGAHYNRHNPGSWPTQAGLLADGKIEEFEKLTDELMGGK